jgi:deoxycytidylate deaminase
MTTTQSRLQQPQQPSQHHSNKIARLAGFAADESRLSVQQFKHGAILCKSGKKICAGHNIDTRTSYRRNICCSVHAEMGTVTKFLNSYIKIHATRNLNKIKRKLSKFSICVVRSVVINGQICYANSNPCCDCIKKLQTVGLKNIMYSDENGNIITQKIATFNASSFVTGSMKKQKFIENMRFKSLI